MRNVKITQTEWMSELNKLRGTQTTFTPEIDKVILYARDIEPKVTYPKLLEFLHTKFGWQGGKSTLRDRYITLKKLPS